MQGSLDPEPIDHACPICAASGRAVVYRLDSLPVQSNLLMQDRRQALECDRGRMALAECSACGFIENVHTGEALDRQTTRQATELRVHHGGEESSILVVPLLE